MTAKHVLVLKPGEWNAYRVVCKGGDFEVFQNELNSAHTSESPRPGGISEIVVGHLPPSGKLSLVMPAGEPSEIEFRNIRLKE